MSDLCKGVTLLFSAHTAWNWASVYTQTCPCDTGEHPRTYLTASPDRSRAPRLAAWGHSALGCQSEIQTSRLCAA